MTYWPPMSHKKRVENKRYAIACLRKIVERVPHRKGELEEMISDAVALDPRAFKAEKPA